MKKKSYLLIVFLIIMSIVSGCQWGKSDEKDQNDYQIYFLNNNETKLNGQSYQLDSTKTENMIEEMLGDLQSQPSVLSDKQTIPDNLIILKSTIENGIVRVHFDPGYNNVNGLTEILMRAAIVKTLCQLEDVKSVEFYVVDQPLTDAEGNVIGAMDASMFVDSSDSFNINQYEGITLYFANSSGKGLVETYIDDSIEDDSTVPIERTVINMLISGPSGINVEDSEGIQKTIPEGTVCNRISISSGICYVDFNAKFLDGVDGVNDEVVICSIVNSLVELSTINKVQFTIDGETMKVYGNFTGFDLALERNLDL